MQKISPSIITTIGDLIDNDYILRGWCRTCLRSRNIDLDGLCERIGRNSPYAGLQSKLICHQCGGRDVAMSIAPPAWRVTP